MDENMYNTDPMNNMGEPQQNGSAGMSIAGMVLGIVSLVCRMRGWGIVFSFVCGIVGIIFSALALKGNKPGRGMAIAGLVCSLVGTVGVISFLILYSSLSFFRF